MYRKVRENPIYKNSIAFHCWSECLFRATHDAKEIYVGRERVSLSPGQFLFGRKEFSTSLNISPSTAWFWLTRLKVDRMIDIKSVNRYSIGTILNWKQYQEVDSNLDRKKTADEQQMNTNKNDKNVRNIILKNNTRTDMRDLDVDFILETFEKTMGFKPTDKYPRRIAYVFKRQINKFIDELAPHRSDLTFRGTVEKSFDWYVKLNEQVQARTLDVIRRNVVNILFDQSKKKYGKGGKNA